MLFLQFRKTLKSYGDWWSRWRCLPVASFIAAAELYQKGEYDKAINLYELGLKSHPRSPAVVNALLDLSHCFFRLRKFEDAERVLRQAKSCAPSVRETYVRLARLQLWLGHATEALWTMRVCLQKVTPDPEIASLFITAVVESGGLGSSVSEAQALLASLPHDDGGFARLNVARARLGLFGAEAQKSRDELSKIASSNGSPFEAVVAFAEILLNEGKLAYAQHHLHRALLVAPEHPAVLRLLAELYLKEGPLSAPNYSVQLSQLACQVTGWRGVKEMLVLAHSHVATSDTIAALLVATKAKNLAARLIGAYPEVERLESLLQNSSVGSQV